MSAETTPKLEAFLIVAYKPLRGSWKAELSLTKQKFNSMLSRFRISEREDVLPTHAATDCMCFVTQFGKQQAVSLVLMVHWKMLLVEQGKTDYQVVNIHFPGHYPG